MGYDEKALEKKEDTGNVLSDEVQNSLIEAIPTRRVHFHEPFIFELCTMFVYLNITSIIPRPMETGVFWPGSSHEV